MAFWQGLPAWAQDAMMLAGFLAPLAVLALVLLPGHAPWPLARALMRRHWGVSAVFVTLIAVSVAILATIVVFAIAKLLFFRK